MDNFKKLKWPFSSLHFYIFLLKIYLIVNFFGKIDDAVYFQQQKKCKTEEKRRVQGLSRDIHPGDSWPYKPKWKPLFFTAGFLVYWTCKVSQINYDRAKFKGIMYLIVTMHYIEPILSAKLGAYYNGPKFKCQPTSGTGWFSYKIWTKNSKTPMINLLTNRRLFWNYIFKIQWEIHFFTFSNTDQNAPKKKFRLEIWIFSFQICF